LDCHSVCWYVSMLVRRKLSIKANYKISELAQGYLGLLLYK